MVSLNRKRKLFRQYNNGLVTFDRYNSLENNFTTALRFATNYHGKPRFVRLLRAAKKLVLGEFVLIGMPLKSGSGWIIGVGQVRSVINPLL